MALSLPNRIVHWHRRIGIKYRYYNRLVRAFFLKKFLRLCLALFKIEKCWHCAPKGHEKRILVIVIGGLGDSLLFDPLFRRLKEKWPNARIDVVTGCFEQMWERIESVDNLILFSPSKFKPPWAYARLFRTIYRNGYDIVAEGIAMVPKRGIFPIFSSLIFEASCASIRIGRENSGRMSLLYPHQMGFIGHEQMAVKDKDKLDSNRNPYLTHIIRLLPPERRECHESANIFESVDVAYHRKPDEPKLLADPITDRWAKAVVRTQWAGENDIIIGMTVETTRQIKSWPLDNFLYIIRKGIQDNFKFIMLGLAKEPSGWVSCQFSKDNVFDMSGRTSLGEMISIIRQCNVFLSCDTGPAHIAQACRVPTIVLFGPSNEREFGPVDRQMHQLILPPEDLKCRPCVLGPCVRRQSCIHLIDPDVVYQALKRKVIESQHIQDVQIFGTRKQPQRQLCAI